MARTQHKNSQANLRSANHNVAVAAADAGAAGKEEEEAGNGNTTCMCVCDTCADTSKITIITNKQHYCEH